MSADIVETISTYSIGTATKKMRIRPYKNKDNELYTLFMRCPEEGEAFIAWKCCTDLRVVMMLVPKDAKRCMATMETGRVSKVKVLKIMNID